MQPRIVWKRTHNLLKQFPILTILGARQIGKSTLARWAFPDFATLDLEDAGDFERLAADPPFLFARHPRLVLDEAQRLPALFPALRSFIDRNPDHRIILLGSASPHLLRSISESLTGRTSFIELSGISIFEHDFDALWVKGGFPRIHWSRPKAAPEEWYPAYLRTCLEKDIPQLGFHVSSLRMRRLLTMVAHSQGSLCNLSELGASLGINYHTVAHLLDIFEGIFLLRRLSPYFANIGKRLVKSPKIYLRDTGILHSLLGIPFSKKDLLSRPKAGASFETFCIEQIVLLAQLADPGSSAFFYRTHAGQEVDLLLQLRGDLVPIEFKLGITPRETPGLENCMRDLGLSRGYLVNLCTNPIEVRQGILMCNLATLLETLKLRPPSPPQ